MPSCSLPGGTPASAAYFERVLDPVGRCGRSRSRRAPVVGHGAQRVHVGRDRLPVVHPVLHLPVRLPQRRCGHHELAAVGVEAGGQLLHERHQFGRVARDPTSRPRRRTRSARSRGRCHPHSWLAARLTRASTCAARLRGRRGSLPCRRRRARRRSRAPPAPPRRPADRPSPAGSASRRSWRAAAASGSLEPLSPAWYQNGDTASM